MYLLENSHIISTKKIIFLLALNVFYFIFIFACKNYHIHVSIFALHLHTQPSFESSYVKNIFRTRAMCLIACDRLHYNHFVTSLAWHKFIRELFWELSTKLICHKLWNKRSSMQIKFLYHLLTFELIQWQSHTESKQRIFILHTLFYFFIFFKTS